MKNKTYQTIIGLEVHVELKTKSKMFCGCSAQYFGKEPNTHVCPVCLGLPGAIPVPNKTAIEWCIMIGLALNCEIPSFSKFDRKNYFYPDLPKGYQISQYDQPFCVNGSVKLSNGKIIKIRRVHMEEDTGKLIHRKGDTLIDFNRSGVPLVEIVTEPDFTDVIEVRDYAKKLQQLFRYLGVSNVDMERGDMRLEANVSVRKVDSHIVSGNTDLPNYRVELKNINSFRFMVAAIEYEIKRQIAALEAGEKLSQETRGWDEGKKRTYLQRIKEEAMDYRYFPEPDIPPINWTKSQTAVWRTQLPELPDAKFNRFKKNYELADYDAEILTREKETADYFEEAVKVGAGHMITPKQIANVVINKKINILSTLPARLIAQIVSFGQTTTINDKELETVIEQIISENPKAVADYRKGKENAILFLVGRVMHKLTVKIDPNQVQKTLKNLLQ